MSEKKNLGKEWSKLTPHQKQQAVKYARAVYFEPMKESLDGINSDIAKMIELIENNVDVWYEMRKKRIDRRMAETAALGLPEDANLPEDDKRFLREFDVKKTRSWRAANAPQPSTSTFQVEHEPEASGSPADKDSASNPQV